MTHEIHSLERSAATSAPDSRDTFARAVLAGLSRSRKAIPSVYHYDARGSQLFKQITALPEHYLTGCELETLQRNKERRGSSSLPVKRKGHGLERRNQ